MGEYSSLILIVALYATQAFSSLASLENMPQSVRRTGKLTLLLAYSGNGLPSIDRLIEG